MLHGTYKVKCDGNFITKHIAKRNVSKYIQKDMKDIYSAEVVMLFNVDVRKDTDPDIVACLYTDAKTHQEIRSAINSLKNVSYVETRLEVKT